MAAIIVLLVIFGSMALGAASIAAHLYHDAKKDNEYYELFHKTNDD
jgi:hypothetical protein